jgi:hypothetical protein
MVEKALLDAVKTLERRGTKTSRQLIAQDRVINTERYAIESETRALIACAGRKPHPSDG